MQGKTNRLVYATPFEMEKDKWGYKWVGICNGKRFSVIQNPYGNEVILDEEKQEYTFVTNDQRNLLPSEIIKLIWQIPLSNKYFILSDNGKEISIEVVLELLEKGYDISKIEMEKVDPSILCRYVMENKVIVEILQDKSILWKGGCL